jgi:hypothetical protein
MTVVIFYRIRDIRASKAPKITASMEYDEWRMLTIENLKPPKVQLCRSLDNLARQEYDEWRMLTIENLKPPKVQLCRSLDDLAGRSREYTQADLPPLLPGKTARFNIRLIITCMYSGVRIMRVGLS